MKQVVRPQGIIAKENKFVRIFALLALLTGVFLAAFDVLSHAVFLQSFGYKYLATAYIGAGLLGSLISYIYSLIYRKFHVKRLNTLIVSVILLTVGAYLVQVSFFPNNINAYVGMLMLFPLNGFLIFLFWRIGRKLLTQKQSKEIIPRIKFYHIVGWAIGGLLIFGGLRLGLSVGGLALLVLGLIVLVWLVQLFLFRVHSNHADIYREGKDIYIPVSKSMVLFFTSKFSTALYFFCLFGAVAAIGVHYVFINVAFAGFQNVVGLSKFYGLFIAVLMVFILGIDRFLIRKILYSYDSPYSLIIVPVVMFAAVVIALGGFHFFSKYQAHEHFTFYFLLLVVAKVGIESMREIIQTPSLRVLFQSMDIRYRQVVYPRMEVSVVMVGVGVAGAIILPLTFLPFFTLNGVLYAVAFVCVLWLLWGVRLLRQYRKIQAKHLGKLKFNNAQVLTELSLSEKAWDVLTGNNAKKTQYLLSVFKKVRPVAFEGYLSGMLEHHNQEVRYYVIKQIIKEQVAVLLPEIQQKAKIADSEEKALLTSVVDELMMNKFSDKTDNELKELIYTADVNDRLYLADRLSQRSDSDAQLLLYDLAKDIDEQVQVRALKYISRYPNPLFNYMLVEHIYPEQYIPYAGVIISKTEEEALEALERELAQPNLPNLVSLRIYGLMTAIKSVKSIDNVLAKINGMDQQMLYNTLQGLINIQYRVDQKNKYRILNLIVKQIGVITRNYNTYYFLLNSETMYKVAESYRYEINRNYDLLYKLLSIVYNANVMASLQTIFIEGSFSQVHHAIELIDLYIDEELKPLMFPLVENIGIKKRIKRLEHFFAQPKLSHNDIIQSTLTGDFNSLSLWPRVCVLMHIYRNELTGFEDEVLFNTFHKEPLLNETALFILSKHNSEKFNDLKQQSIGDSARMQQVEDVEKMNVEDLIYSKVEGVMACEALADLPESVLVTLASSAKVCSLFEGETFDLTVSSKNRSLLFVSENSLITENNLVIYGYNKLINGNILVDLGVNQVKATNDCKIWLFDNRVVEQLMLDYIDLLDLFVEVVDNTVIIED